MIGHTGDDELEIVDYGDGSVVTLDGTRVGTWPSDAALIADVAAARLFADRDHRWDQYNPEQRGELLTGVRLFLETCPTSGGPISMSEETVESCCQSHDILAVTCDETGERILELPVDEFEI